MLAIVDRSYSVHREMLPNIWMKVPDSKNSRWAGRTTALIGVSQFLAGYTILTYLYTNMSEFDNTANGPPLH
jgi:hypothetical protein